MTNPDKHWYRKGLCFSCTQCGNCCTGEPGVVWVDEEEILAIADYLGKSIGEVKLFQTRLYANRVTLTEYANGDCVFFDAELRTCQIYPVRPKQCRTWPFWSSNLNEEQSWKKAQQECPGMGTGQLYSLEQIEERRKVIEI